MAPDGAMTRAMTVMSSGPKDGSDVDFERASRRGHGVVVPGSGSTFLHVPPLTPSLPVTRATGPYVALLLPRNAGVATRLACRADLAASLLHDGGMWLLDA
jgi:hypothetical protein